MKRMKKFFVTVGLLSMFATQTAFADSNVNTDIYNHLKNWDTEFKIDYYDSDVINVITNVSSQNGYIERTISGIRYSRIGKNATIKISYRTTKEQEQYIHNQLSPVISDINKNYTTTYDKVKAVNDYVTQKYNYDYTLLSNNAYSALTTGSTTCQGYSLTVSKMLDMLNIENKLVVGKLKNTPHGWNMVKIDGNWYQLDATNNDVQQNKFFMVNDTTLLNNGFSWDAGKYPVCSTNFIK